MNRGYMLWIAFLWGFSIPVTAQDVESVITEERVTAVIGALAHDSMMGRGNYQRGLDKAADYIAVHFAGLSLQPLDTFLYKIPFTKRNRKGFQLANVIGILPGKSKPEEWVIISAHYDHMGVEGKRGDTVFNGANDDASGTTAVLLLAEYFARMHNNERTLVFCCFAGEELGLRGSFAFARSITDPSKIKAVLNIEMIGRYEIPYGNSAFVTGDQFSDLFSILSTSLKGTGYHLYPDPQQHEDKEAAQRLFYRSDHLPFAYKDIAAHSIMSSTDKDPYYHKKDDELQHIQTGHLTNVIRTIALSMRSLVDGTTTPGKIDGDLLERVEHKYRP